MDLKKSSCATALHISIRRFTLACVLRSVSFGCVGAFARRISLTLIFLGAALLSAGIASAAVDFNRDIQPILAENCYACHGAGKQEGDLRLDRAEGVVVAKGEEDGIIVPGKSANSEMIRRVLATEPDELMPPAESGKKLTAEQRELLRQWVDQGAKYEKHWSLVPPVKVEPPKPAANIARVVNPIDAFIGARLEQAKLSMAPEADRETLIRRVSFALTGLPPTPEELAEYLRDMSPAAYENMVDRYMASPRFGEEMSRHWLDLVRYGDTHGLHLDNERLIWSYRDWVISAFNKNKPFDKFTIEQLAGDLIPDGTQEQLVGTGFNRCNVTTGEGGSIEDEWIFRNAVDRTSTMSEVWMGLTAGCSVCHNHKFDPITAKEYYSLYAFFYSAADPPLDNNALETKPVIRLETKEQLQQLKEYEERAEKARDQLEHRFNSLKYRDPFVEAKKSGDVTVVK
ncbi:MAG: DUF1549 domain-containing protein, partial [Planctomycetota bacterium]|nr:DUF1549 domain-containing protein [Planctomycetota bacterium]